MQNARKKGPIDPQNERSTFQGHLQALLHPVVNHMVKWTNNQITIVSTPLLVTALFFKTMSHIWKSPTENLLDSEIF